MKRGLENACLEEGNNEYEMVKCFREAREKGRYMQLYGQGSFRSYES